MKILYLDESGNCNLQKIDPLYPVFALGGVVVDSDDFHFNAELINNFKKKYFDTTDIILHTCDIIRQRNGFEILKRGDIWRTFIADMNDLMRNLRYSVIICVINKNKYCGLDIFGDAFERVMDSFYNSLTENQGRVIIESAGKIQDAGVLVNFGQLKNNMEDRIIKMEIEQKIKNLPGLQLADLVLSPIARHWIGKSDAEDFMIVMGKAGSNGVIIV